MKTLQTEATYFLQYCTSSSAGYILCCSGVDKHQIKYIQVIHTVTEIHIFLSQEFFRILSSSEVFLINFFLPRAHLQLPRDIVLTLVESTVHEQIHANNCILNFLHVEMEIHATCTCTHILVFQRIHVHRFAVLSSCEHTCRYFFFFGGGSVLNSFVINMHNVFCFSQFQARFYLFSMYLSNPTVSTGLEPSSFSVEDFFCGGIYR